MIEVICKVDDKIQMDGKDYLRIIESNSHESYIIPLDQLFNEELFIGSEYRFYKQYNSKFQKYFLIQEHPYYKLNGTYDFKIKRKEYFSNESEVENFILEDQNNNELKVKAYKWQKENWPKETLTCQVIAYNKNGIVLKNSDFSNLPYNIGEVYEFNISGFGTYTNKKNQEVPCIIVENHDGSPINVTALDWQTENSWNHETLFCEVLKYNSSGMPHLRNKDIRHPIFEVNKTYSFKVQGFKTWIDLKNENKKYDIIELEGLDGCIHETNALPGQMLRLNPDDEIQCIVRSIGYKIRLSQTNIKDPYFSSIETIIKDHELITKYFLPALANEEDEECRELKEKYDSNSAFWIFTFCNKILTKSFRDYSNRFDYKSSMQIADMIIILENWIIKKGIIASFPDDLSRKNTLKKAKNQLEKYSRIKRILDVLDNFDLQEYFARRHSSVSNNDIEELNYILILSNIEQVNEILFFNYVQELLKSITLSDQNSYSLIKLDNSIQSNKQAYYNNDYEKSFNLSFKNNSLFKSDSFKNKYFTWSFCQYIINEKLQNFERANYLIGKILRQYFFSASENSIKEKLLYNAYFFQNNQTKVNDHPLTFKDGLILDENKLHENPNCCTEDLKYWSQIIESFEKGNCITVNITQKQLNGYIVNYNGIKGFLPFNHITESKLKHYNHNEIDFTLTVNCFLVSEEFNFYVAKQPMRDSSEHICTNNLLGNIKPNEIVLGQVKAIEDYGIFISGPWGEGLLHRKNISTHYWDKVLLNTYFKKGEKITVKVIDQKDGKIELSLKGLIDTKEEEKYLDFINYVDFGDIFSKESETIDNDEELLSDQTDIKLSHLEKAFCFEQYAILKKSLDEKIHFLRLSKQFFSSVNNPRSYLINIYTNYFELLKLLDNTIISFSFEKIDVIKVEAQKILEKINAQKQTLEIFPESEKLIFFINILSLFNDKTEQGIDTLYNLLRENSDKKILKTIAKIALANNLIVSESKEHSDFVRKNLRHIKSYLDEGVFSLKETETDKLERELREKVKYWSGRINGDESENLEFKSSFKTPIPDQRMISEKKRLLKLLETVQNKEKIKRDIDKIDGELASKAVIHSALKTLCAFSNTNGGTLLIGVADDKSIIGLEKDYVNLKKKKDRDGFGLFFDAKISEYFEPTFSSLLEREFIKFPDGDILVVVVKQSVDPIFLLKDKEGKPTEDLFVRDLTSTKEIKGKRELMKFFKQKEKEQEYNQNTENHI